MVLATFRKSWAKGFQRDLSLFSQMLRENFPIQLSYFLIFSFFPYICPSVFVGCFYDVSDNIPESNDTYRKSLYYIRKNLPIQNPTFYVFCYPFIYYNKIFLSIKQGKFFPLKPLIGIKREEFPLIVE